MFLEISKSQLITVKFMNQFVKFWEVEETVSDPVSFIDEEIKILEKAPYPRYHNYQEIFYAIVQSHG